MSCPAPQPPEPQGDFRQHLIDVLRWQRQRLGLSQEAVDDRVGVTNGLVAKWESGARRPSHYLLWCWAEALGVELRVHIPS